MTRSLAPAYPRRIGVLGGTFDPPHYGHLLAAQEACWHLHLDRVLFVPTRQNPLKQGERMSAVEQRARMVQLAIADNPHFVFSRADLDRVPPLYTVDLLRLLRTSYPDDVAFFFLAGADLLPELARWRDPEEILHLATFVAVVRPGWPVPTDAMLALEERYPSARGRVVPLRTPGVDISSTDIRERVRLGRPICYLTPKPVEDFIEQHALYRDSAPSG